MEPIKGTTSDHNAPAANTAAVITYAADANRRHVVDQIAWSYDGAPTGGAVTIEDGSGTTVFEIAVTAAGPNQITFSAPLSGSYNTAMVVTLAAGGAGVTGKLTARHRTF